MVRPITTVLYAWFAGVMKASIMIDYKGRLPVELSTSGATIFTKDSNVRGDLGRWTLSTLYNVSSFYSHYGVVFLAERGPCSLAHRILLSNLHLKSVMKHCKVMVAAQLSELVRPTYPRPYEPYSGRSARSCGCDAEDLHSLSD